MFSIFSRRRRARTTLARSGRTLRQLRQLPFVLALAAGYAQGGVLHSRFDNDAEGWAAAGNGGGGVNWLAEDGNPDGHLGMSDMAGGWAYFAAPAAYRAAILPGGLLSFDLRTQTDAGHPVVSAVRVALVGGGLTLVAESVRPDADWTRYDFMLGLGGAFRVLPSASDEYAASNRLPTSLEWASVLGSLNSFYISADYSIANAEGEGFETTELDNVRLEATPLATVPEPGSLSLLGMGGASLALAWRRRRRSRPASP